MKGPARRLARGQQQRDRADAARTDPDARRRELLAAERGTIFREAPLKVALGYPLPYRAAMSSLGYQVVYRALNSRPTVSCERFVLPDDVAEHRRRRLPLGSLETGRPVAAFDLIGVSAICY